jgi:hypothetical protein
MTSSAMITGRSAAAVRMNNIFLFKANRLSLSMNEPPSRKSYKILHPENIGVKMLHFVYFNKMLS